GLTESQKAQVAEYRDDLEDNNASELARWVKVPKGTRLKLPDKSMFQAEKDLYLGDVAEQKLGDPTKAQTLLKQNKSQLIPHVKVSVGTNLRLPDYTYTKVEKETTLGEYAKTKLGNEDKAQVLWDRNKKSLKLPDRTPDGADQLKEAETLPEGA